MHRRVSVADPAATAVKALDLLEVLSDERAGLGLNQLSRHLGSSRTSTSRLLAALQLKKLVTRDRQTRKYRLTLRLLELGTRLLNDLELPDLAKTHLQALSSASGETAHLGVLDGWSVIFVGKAEPPNPIRLHARVGFRAPTHCTSLGKVLVAGLPAAELADYLAGYEFRALTPQTISTAGEFAEHLQLVRERGHAFDAEEHRPGIACVGAPVRAHDGQIVAAMSVSGPAFRMNERRRKHLAPVVAAAAAAFSADLGWTRTSVRLASG